MGEYTIEIKHKLYGNPESKGEIMFHSNNGLFFTRNDDGSVTITKTDGKAVADGGNVIFEQTLDDGTWASTVLSMTAFSERPGDWHAFMRHHKGVEDILVGKRGGY